MDLLENKKILIVDDDTTQSQLIKIAFRDTGASMFLASDGREGLRKFFEQRPDLVILDIMMPGMNGFETCQQMRFMADTPIIMLTALQNNKDIVRGLNSGADDFISKPFAPEVLLARARAVLRRADQPLAKEPGLHYDDGYLAIDLQRRTVTIGGKAIQLTPTEFRLLMYLLEQDGGVASYQEILENVWGDDSRDNIDYVHVYLSHLRRKIEKNPRYPEYLLTEHGIGYRFQRLNQE